MAFNHALTNVVFCHIFDKEEGKYGLSISKGFFLGHGNLGSSGGRKLPRIL
jgi:hypothetical protein